MPVGARAVAEVDADVEPAGGADLEPAADLEARRTLRDWCLDEQWFAPARPDCHLMHCLPVRRNVALADALLDGARAVVLRQAYNRLPAQVAVLHQLLKPAQ